MGKVAQPAIGYNRCGMSSVSLDFERSIIIDQTFIMKNIKQIDQRGPEINRDEIYAEIRNMKNGKASGIDDMQAEFLKKIEDA